MLGLKGRSMSVTDLRIATMHASEPDLLREANHRISNHLALLAGTVQIQAGALTSGPDMLPRESVRTLLMEAAAKIVSVGHLHRRLAERPGRHLVNLGDYLIDTCANLVSSLSLGGRVHLVQRLAVNCNVTPDQAQHIGLMICEIVMNAVKHAHPTGLPVQIALICRREADGRVTIEIGDDGVGLPEDSKGVAGDGVGLKLVRSLARALNSELRIETSALGLTFLITLPPQVQSIAIAAG